MNGPSERSPLKILILTSDRYPPFRPAAKAIFGEEFSRRKHQVDWLMQAEDPSQDGGKCKYGNGWAYLAQTQIGNSRLHRVKKYMLSFVNDLRVFSLARKYRYDVIQVKDKYIVAVLGLIAAKLYGSKFCFWLAYPHPEANLYGAKHRVVRYPFLYWIRGHYQSFLLYKIILPFSDHAFVQSQQMKTDICAKGIDENLLTPVPGSLNLDTLPYRGKEDPGPDGPVVLYIGTLIRKRRLDFVVRMFAEVLSSVPNAKLLFVGKGQTPEDDALLHDEVRNQGIDENLVEFVGEVPMNKVWRYIERSAVCLSPYYPTFELNSTSPTKLIEYMAMGRPVVANEHPEQSLVLEESGGGICVPWDEGLFAAAVVRLLQNPLVASEMSKNGRAWVERNRTNSIMADLVENRYYMIVPALLSGDALSVKSVDPS